MNEHANNFTLRQVNWAAAHDWFISATASRITVRGDHDSEHTIKFYDFEALYIWAGY